MNVYYYYIILFFIWGIRHNKRNNLGSTMQFKCNLQQAIIDKLRWACSTLDRSLHRQSCTILPFISTILATALTAAIHQTAGLDTG